jgi:E3 ubiquitin-protein ligase UBR4
MARNCIPLLCIAIVSYISRIRTQVTFLCIFDCSCNLVKSFFNRAINYDEKDPFLCHACGFCKYAKFDYTLTGRACCAVDPIESDDDRKKTVATINSLLEKADRVYKQLIANKPTLEVSVVHLMVQDIL